MCIRSRYLVFLRCQSIQPSAVILPSGFWPPLSSSNIWRHVTEMISAPLRGASFDVTAFDDTIPSEDICMLLITMGQTRSPPFCTICSNGSWWFSSRQTIYKRLCVTTSHSATWLFRDAFITCSFDRDGFEYPIEQLISFESKPFQLSPLLALSLSSVAQSPYYSALSGRGWPLPTGGCEHLLRNCTDKFERMHRKTITSAGSTYHNWIFEDIEKESIEYKSRDFQLKNTTQNK